MSPLARRSLLALVAGLGAGYLVARVDIAWLTDVAFGIEPLGTAWVRAIRMTVLPLVVSLVVAALASRDEAGEAARTGGRAFLFFLVLLLGAGALAVFASPPLFDAFPLDPAGVTSLQAEAGTEPAGASELGSPVQWVLELIPRNPVRAAVDGAMLPLLVFTVLFALALTRIAGKPREAVVGFFEGTAEASLVLVRWVLAATPVGVFALSLGMATELGAAAVGAVAVYTAVHCGLLVVVIVLLYPVAVVGGGLSLSSFARAMAPPQAVAFTSRSSLATLPVLIEEAEDTLHLPEEGTDFLLPLSASVLKINQPVSWVTGALFIAHLYGVDLGFWEVAYVGGVATAMSFTTPGIPSGGLVLMTPFFADLGLPAAGVGILIAADAIPDTFKTTANVTAYMTTAAVLGRPAEGEVGSPGRKATTVAADGDRRDTHGQV